MSGAVVLEDAVRGALRRQVKHLRILAQYARIGVVRKSQFRVELLSQVVMDCVWYSVKIATFEVLFLYTKRIAGWSAPEVRLLLAYVFVSDSFMMMWLTRRWRFGRELKDGKLDAIRVRPASPVVLYFFQDFSLEAGVNMAVAFGYLGFATWRSGLPHGPATWLLLAWAVALAWWTFVVTCVMFAIADLWVLDSDISNLVSRVFDNSGSYPLDIFSKGLRQLLLWVVPVGLIAYLPASLVLRRASPLAGLAASAFILAFGWIVFRAWRWSFRRYESAMG